MDVREKLIEILKQAPFEGKVLDEWWWEEKIRRIADHLISNGVTVQEWISVEDRLPDNKEHDWVLAQVVEDNGYMHIPKVMEYRQSKNDCFEETYGWLSKHNGLFTVTHWMPLPLAPGGGRVMAKCIEKAEGHCKSYPRCYGCNAYRDPTNADRIRAMSDEELDYFLHKVTYGMDECPHEYGSEKALKWLQHPVEEE